MENTIIIDNCQKIELAGKQVRDVAFSPDSQRLAVVLKKKSRVILIDVSRCQQVDVFSKWFGTLNPVIGIFFVTDEFVALFRSNSIINIWNSKTYQMEKRFSVPLIHLGPFRFSTSLSTFAAGYYAGDDFGVVPPTYGLLFFPLIVQRNVVQPGPVTLKSARHKSPITCLRLFPGRGTFYSFSSGDGLLAHWNASGPEPSLTVDVSSFVPELLTSFLLFNANEGIGYSDQKIYYCAVRESRIMHYKAIGMPLDVLEPHPELAFGLFYSGGAPSLLSFKSLEVQNLTDLPRGEVTCIRFAPNGERVCVATRSELFIAQCTIQ